MASARRSEVVREGEVGVYHVWSRCVKRAFLCRVDPLTGMDFEYRRDWIHAFLKQFALLFGVEVGIHAELSNHVHLVLRARTDVVATWSDREVAVRTLLIERLIKSKDGVQVRKLKVGEIAIETTVDERLAELRRRLAIVRRNTCRKLCAISSAGSIETQ